MPQGISKNPLTDISKVYLEQVSAVEIDERLGGKGYKRRKDYAGRTVEGDWPDSDRGAGNKAKRRAGEKVEKKSPTYRAYVLNKEEKECECDCGKVPCVTCGEDHHKVDEGFSDWRSDLSEYVGSTGPGLQTNPGLDQSPDGSRHSVNNEKIKEKKVKNKIKINPSFQESAEELTKVLGGHLLEVSQIVDKDQEDGEPDDKKAELQKKKEQMLKKRIIRMKMMAVNSGNDEGIIASYQPEIEGAVQFFYEQGINEEGLDQVIEDVGLEDFVDFVLDASEFLTEEERPARKMNVRTLKATKKKAAEIKADKSDVVKRGTPLDTVRRARAERASKKPKLAKPSAPVKKVEKSVEKVKATQPTKRPNKQSIRDRVTSAFKKGVERHKKAVSKNEFTKGVASGVKAVGKAVRDVDSVLKVNKKTTVNMQSYEPEGDFIDEDTKRTTKGRWVDKKGRSHKFSVSTHTGDEQHVGSIIKSQYPAKRVVITGQSVDKKKKTASKKKKKVEEEVGISSAAAMEKARKEAELRRKEEQAVKKEKKALKKEEVQLEDRSTFKKAMSRVFGKKKEEERKPQKAQDAGARLRRQKARQEYADKVSGSVDLVPDDLRDHYEIAELNRYGKETGKATGSLNKRPGSPVRRGGDEPGALRNVRAMIRKETGKPEGQKRRDYDERHSAQNRRESPASTVTKRRERKARADAAMRDTRGT